MNDPFVDARGQRVNQFGTPVLGSPLASYDAPAAAPPPRRGVGPTVAKAIVAALLVTVVVAITVRFAWPAYQDHRARAEAPRISVSLPASVAGYERLGDGSNEAMQELPALFPFDGRPASGAAYGDSETDPAVIVIAGRHLMLREDRRSFLDGIAKTAKEVGNPMKRVDAGPLGGEMQCGELADATSTICAFADYGAFGAIFVMQGGPAAQALVRQVRSAIETKR